MSTTNTTGLSFGRNVMLSFVCETCGQKFERSERTVSSLALQGRRARYCSKQCLYNRNTKSTFACQYCGASFQRYQADIRKAAKRGGTIRFCSKACDIAHGAQGNTQHKCEVCGKEFILWASQRQEGKRRGWNRGRFCSISCRDKSDYQAHRNQSITVKCLWCDAELIRKPHRLARNNYCDRVCAMNYRRHKALQRYQKPCSVCGEMLVLRDGEPIPNYAKRMTCSADCRRLQQNHTRFDGGEPATPYPPEFNKVLRYEIRERDGFACQECGVLEDGRAHDVHHVDYDQQRSEPANLITLCFSCHRRTTNPGNRKDEWIRHYQEKMRSRVNRTA